MNASRFGVTARAFLYAFGAFASGVCFLLLSAYFESLGWPIRASIARELGAFCVVTVIVALFWELVGRRAFSDELYEKIGMSRDLAIAGVRAAVVGFANPQISFHELFHDSRTLDLWVAYGSTWRNSNLQNFEQMLARENSRVRVILPNPKNQAIVRTLASRFQKTEDSVREVIQETVLAYRRLGAARNNVEVLFADKLPTFTFYLFDNRAVLALYSHRSGREIPVLTMLCTHEGAYFRYLRDEFDSLLAGGVNAQ